MEFLFEKSGALKGLLLPTASCSSTPVGSTPVGAVPAMDESAAKAAAQATLARDQGLPIGTEGQPSAQEQAAQLAATSPAIVGRTNPGSFDKADDLAKRVINPDYFDGLRIVVNNMFSQNFSASHEFSLGSAIQQGSSYHFGVTASPREGTLLISRLSKEGAVDAQVHHAISKKLNFQGVASCQPDASRSVVQADFQYAGDDFTATMKMSQGPYLGLSYFQAITKNISMGGEAMCSAGQGYSHLFARAKYADDKNTATVTYGTVNRLQASYFRSVNERVSLACELEVNTATNESMMNLGYDFILRQARVQGTLSTDGVLATQVTHVLAPGFNLILNGILDHAKNTHRFGYGVQFG